MTYSPDDDDAADRAHERFLENEERAWRIYNADRDRERAARTYTRFLDESRAVLLSMDGDRLCTYCEQNPVEPGKHYCDNDRCKSAAIAEETEKS